MAGTPPAKVAIFESFCQQRFQSVWFVITLKINLKITQIGFGWLLKNPAAFYAYFSTVGRSVEFCSLSVYGMSEERESIICK